MREPKDNDFFVELPTVGSFRFGRRSYGDRLEIRKEFLTVAGWQGDVDDDVALYASTIASFRVLCVEAPKGWEDLAEIDLVENPKAGEQIIELYRLMQEKEASFLKGATKSGEGDGTGGP